MLKRLGFLLLSIILMQSCGGSSNNSNSQTPPPLATDIEITIPDLQYLVGQNIELVLLVSNQAITDIKWTQTQGNTVFIASPKSKVISVLPKEAGSYSFNVEFTISGQKYNNEKTIEVVEHETKLNIPNGHAVLEGNNVSLRAFTNGAVNSINWHQISGPNIAIDNKSSNTIFFDAPQVSQDIIASFNVNALIDDREESTTVSILIENADDIEDNAYFDDRVAKVFPHNQNGEYAQSLLSCVYNNELSSACTLAELPLLARPLVTPTIDEIMDRVVVSHPWMANRFEQFLTEKDIHNDFKNLLRATTAIVIAYDIRPSFYWAATGAIYLDAESFWLTPQERDTINESPDYRSDFGKSLQFSIPWRYVKNNEYAFEDYPIEDRQNRSLDSITYPLAYLLYHELAHANDYFPSTSWNNLDLDARILDEALERDPTSDQLSTLYPLVSQSMKDLAQVRYSGTSATNEQMALLPNDITPLFEPDGGVHFYSFRTEREDFAMLFEELMMQFRYGVYRDVAITNNPTHESDNTGDFIVEWGQRGRLAQTQIVPRVRFATSSILPDFNVEAAIAQIPETKLFTEGLTWQENLNLNNQLQYMQVNQRNISVKNEQIRNAKQLTHKHFDSYNYYSKPLPNR